MTDILLYDDAGQNCVVTECLYHHHSHKAAIIEPEKISYFVYQFEFCTLRQ